jgi:hypothetical protein
MALGSADLADLAYTPAESERPQLDSFPRVWVTPSDRKRCTYVTRDEDPGADSHDNHLVGF